MNAMLLNHRRLASESAQMAIAAMALASAFLLRFEFTLDPTYAGMLTRALPLVLIVKFPVYRAFRTALTSPGAIWVFRIWCEFAAAFR